MTVEFKDQTEKVQRLHITCNAVQARVLDRLLALIKYPGAKEAGNISFQLDRTNNEAFVQMLEKFMFAATQAFAVAWNAASSASDGEVCYKLEKH